MFLYCYQVILLYSYRSDLCYICTKRYKKISNKCVSKITNEERLAEMKKAKTNWVLVLENISSRDWDYYINKNSILQDTGFPSYVYFQILKDFPIDNWGYKSEVYSVKANCETLKIFFLELSLFKESMGNGMKEVPEINPIWRDTDDNEGLLIKVACGKEKLGLKSKVNSKSKENQYIDPGDLWLLGLLVEYASNCGDASAAYKVQSYLNKWGLSQEEFIRKPSAIAGFNQGEKMGCFQKKEFLRARGFL